MIHAVLKKVVNGDDLDRETAEQVLNEIMDGKCSATVTGALLTALAIKGETVAEITGMVKAMRAHSLKVTAEAEAMDTCGTGGSGKTRFNVSTISAFVLASQGVLVAKHGNRASSKGNGSFDLLEKLGININLQPNQVEKTFKKENLGFMFAPLFHPAMKHVVPVRKELGIRTVFNILGPLTNPAGASKQVLGTIEINIAQKLINVLKNLESKRAVVVVGSNGLDEATVLGPCDYYELKDGEITKATLDPASLGLAMAGEADILGGDVAENVKIFQAILQDKKKSPRRDMVLLNAGLGFYIAGKVDSIKVGVALAAESIDENRAWEKYKAYKKLSLSLSK